ncbi:Suppressor of Sensor Kinase (SLN1) [Quaeritorhiza haematococci]|nr:Suppressor of Sensor Kinase (SLN1) [Quaeritorhiza haematococci]
MNSTAGPVEAGKSSTSTIDSTAGPVEANVVMEASVSGNVTESRQGYQKPIISAKLDTELTIFCKTVHDILTRPPSAPITPPAATSGNLTPQNIASPESVSASTPKSTAPSPGLLTSPSTQTDPSTSTPTSTFQRNRARSLSNSKNHPPEIDIPYSERDEEFHRTYPSYHISGLLGRGQAGMVYRGDDDAGNPIFAIKKVQLPHAVGVGLPLRRTFIAYLRVLRLLDHPNVIRYLGWAVEDNEAQVFVEYCDGGDVSGFIYGEGEGGKGGSAKEPGIKDEMLVRRWIKQILLGLDYLHAHGIVHRDLKPSNVLIHRNTLRLADLGAARIHQRCCSTPHQQKMSGSPSYVAPEATLGKVAHQTCAEDIWGLGCCLYEMVMGRVPWSDRTDNVFALYFMMGRCMQEAEMRRKKREERRMRREEKERERAERAEQGNENYGRNLESEKSRGDDTETVEKESRDAPSEDDEEDLDKVVDNPLLKDAEQSGKLSPVGMDFLKKCLRWLPTERPTAAELLQHPFVGDVDIDDDQPRS